MNYSITEKRVMLSHRLKKKFPFFWSILDRIRLVILRLTTVTPHRNIIYYRDFNVIFLSIPKNGSSTINSMFLKKIGDAYSRNEYGSIHLAKSKYRITLEEYKNLDTTNIFVFSFVRNPFARLVSCYRNKIINEPDHQMIREYPSFFYGGMPFETFVKWVCRIPDFWSNKHFQSQYSYVYPGGIDKVDYIGRIENFDEDFQIVIDKVGLQKTDSLNKTSSQKALTDYYDEKTAILVSNRYKKDFDKFGYSKILGNPSNKTT